MSLTNDDGTSVQCTLSCFSFSARLPLLSGLLTPMWIVLTPLTLTWPTVSSCLLIQEPGCGFSASALSTFVKPSLSGLLSCTWCSVSRHSSGMLAHRSWYCSWVHGVPAVSPYLCLNSLKLIISIGEPSSPGLMM